MEEQGNLDIDNDLHMWCLHYIYTPRIQRALDQFREAWNHHRLRSEGGSTPTKLFIAGVINQAGDGRTGIDCLVHNEPVEDVLSAEEREQYGVDVDGPAPAREVNSVEISNVPCPLTDVLFRTLKTTVEPLAGVGLGTELFQAAVQFCNEN
jgi:hypothetical protein